MEKTLEPLAGIDVPRIADFWKWVQATFSPDYQGEVKSYLAQSMDVFDLEQRMKYLRIRGMM